MFWDLEACWVGYEVHRQRAVRVGHITMYRLSGWEQDLKKIPRGGVTCWSVNVLELGLPFACLGPSRAFPTTQGMVTSDEVLRFNSYPWLAPGDTGFHQLVIW